MSDCIALFVGSKSIESILQNENMIHTVELLREENADTGVPEFFINYQTSANWYNFRFSGEDCFTADQVLAFTAYNQIVATIKNNMDFAEIIRKERQGDE
ncbi:hypothetical protein LI811_002117 [Salmonella enterica]|nr:hypothetical protein [Salmonella enterica]